MPPAAPIEENRSNNGWVNLLIESVNVPLDSDGSLLFSTVQSLIPGAHGLYFRDNGQRKALSLDSSTGKVLSPMNGWTAENIFVHLAHGHRHGANCGYGGEYTKASEIFERNLTAVQKLISGAGFGSTRRSGDAKASPKRSHKPKSGFEAQPEEVHVSDESETYLHQQLDAKKKELEKVTSEKEELLLRLKDAESQLEAHKQENEELRNILSQSPTQAGAPEIVIGSPEPTPTSSPSDKKKKGKKGKDDPRDTAIVQLQQELEAEREKFNRITSELSASSSAEKNEAQARIIKLQGELDAAHRKCADWEAQAESLQTELWSEREQHDYKIQELMEREEEMNNLHNLIADLRKRLLATQKEKADVEAHLGSAQEKVSVLEQRGPKAEELEKMSQINERNAYLEQSLNALQHQLGETRDKLERQTAESDDWLGRLTEERNKLQWNIGELTQWWNDAKWRIGELEAGNQKLKDDLETANEQLKKLMEDSRNVTPSGINEAIAAPGARATFSVNRQPNTDRWQLQSYISTDPLIPQASAAPSNQFAYPTYPSYPMPVPYFYPPMMGYPFYPPQFPSPQQNESRRVLFEIEAPEAKTIFLAGSFLNWEVALLCRPLGNGKHGVWVEVPKGQHDFKFLVDGEWRASQCYHIANNEFGSMNNSRTVE